MKPSRALARQAIAQEQTAQTAQTLEAKIDALQAKVDTAVALVETAVVAIRAQDPLFGELLDLARAQPAQIAQITTLVEQIQKQRTSNGGPR